MEFECNSMCSNYHEIFGPSGLNISCLKCPKSSSNGWKMWDLRELEEGSDEPSDKEWRKFLKYLETARHRQCVNGRLERIAELGSLGTISKRGNAGGGQSELFLANSNEC